VLEGSNFSGAEGSTVANAFDLEFGWSIDVARSQEVAVEGMHRAVIGKGSLSGNKAMSQELATEGALSALGCRRPDEYVVADVGEVHQSSECHLGHGAGSRGVWAMRAT
jgi:hypothetical protein